MGRLPAEVKESLEVGKDSLEVGKESSGVGRLPVEMKNSLVV